MESQDYLGKSSCILGRVTRHWKIGIENELLSEQSGEEWIVMIDDILQVVKKILHAHKYIYVHICIHYIYIPGKGLAFESLKSKNRGCDQIIFCVCGCWHTSFEPDWCYLLGLASSFGDFHHALI